jgi:polyisoprenoid-binding protein YceI
MLPQAMPRPLTVRGAALAAASIAALVALAACAPRRAEQPAVAPPAVPTPAVPIPASARTFEIDASQSMLSIRVHKAGPFAALGHNHVVTAGRLSGRAWITDDLIDSGFEIRMPVAALIVDEPAARAAAGSEFEGAVPDSAREGTYRNMVRAEVLDVAEFPDIVVRSAGMHGTWEQPVADVDISIRGATRRVEVPMQVTRSERNIGASGSLQLRQTDFGITPFSVAAGAIQVADELEIEFRIVAVER